MRTGSRKKGTNPRALKTNPRARGTNARSLNVNPRVLGVNQKKLEKLVGPARIVRIRISRNKRKIILFLEKC